MCSLPPEASELTACYGLICKGLLTPLFLCILKLPSSGFDWIGLVAFASRVFQWNNVTEYKPTPTNVTFSDRPWWVQSNGYCGLLHTTIMSFPDGQTVPGKWQFNKKRKAKAHPCLYFLPACNLWIVRMTELFENPVKFSSGVKCWQSQYRHFRVINFRILITWATSRSLIFFISKYNACAQKMAGLYLPEHNKMWMTEMRTYHSQFALTVLPEDQRESWNINSPAAAVTPHLDELKSISLFKGEAVHFHNPTA